MTEAITIPETIKNGLAILVLIPVFVAVCVWRGSR